MSTIEEMWEELKTKGVHHSSIDWREIQEREHVEKHLLQWCVLHFAQASSTPLASMAWLKLLDINNPSSSVEDILNGSFTPEEVPPEVLQFLRACRSKSEADKVDTTLSFEHFRAFFTKQ